jgi:hypothetical protein
MRTSSSEVSSPRDPAKRTTMKRYEVIRHLLHGDFPWQHQYTLSSGCAHHSGQRLSEVAWRAMPSDCMQPLRFSPPMIAHVPADEEQLALALLMSVPQK